MAKVRRRSVFWQQLLLVLLGLVPSGFCLHVLSLDTHIRAFRFGEILHHLGHTFEIFVDRRTRKFDPEAKRYEGLIENGILSNRECTYASHYDNWTWRPGAECGMPPEWGSLTAEELHVLGCNTTEHHIVQQRVLQSDRFRHADVILCTFPLALCQLYLEDTASPNHWHLRKAMLLVPTWRYYLGRSQDCDCGTWARQLTGLMGVGHSISGARAAVLTTDGYEAQHLEHFLGVRPSFEAAGHPAINWLEVGEASLSQRATRHEVLLQPDRMYVVSSADQILLALLPEGLQSRNCTVPLARARELYAYYTARQIVDHHAVVHIPYVANAGSAVDFFWAGVTLIVPSLALLWWMHCDVIDRGANNGLLYELESGEYQHCFGPQASFPDMGLSDLENWTDHEIRYYRPWVNPYQVLSTCVKNCTKAQRARTYPLFVRWMGQSWLYNTPYIRQFGSLIELASMVNELDAESLQQRRARAAEQLHYIREFLLPNITDTFRMALKHLQQRDMDS